MRRIVVCKHRITARDCFVVRIESQYYIRYTHTVLITYSIYAGPTVLRLSGTVLYVITLDVLIRNARGRQVHRQSLYAPVAQLRMFTYVGTYAYTYIYTYVRTRAGLVSRRSCRITLQGQSATILLRYASVTDHTYNNAMQAKSAQKILKADCVHPSADLDDDRTAAV